MTRLLEAKIQWMLLISSALLVGCASGIAGSDSADCGELTQVQDNGTMRICVKEGESRDFGAAILGELVVAAKPVGSSSSTFVGRPAGSRYPVGPQQKQELEQAVAAVFLAALPGLSLKQAEEAGAGVLLVRGELRDLYFELPTDPESGVKDLFSVLGRGALAVELLDAGTGTPLLRSFRALNGESADDEFDSQSAALEGMADLWAEVLAESVDYLRGNRR